ncbi:MAG: hypothetical protein AABX59_02700, partial [Nanoarchaeota archaeon]
MKKILLLTILVIILFIVPLVNAQECLSVTQSKNEFLAGETFQADIEIKNPVQALERKNLELSVNNIKKELPIKIEKLSDEKYFIYFNTLDTGSYKLRLNTLCIQNTVIMEVSKEISFSVKADSVGDAYEKLAKQTTWGNAEENSLAILALRNFDSA